MKLRAQAVALLVMLTTLTAIGVGWGSYRVASQEAYRTVENALGERTARIQDLLEEVAGPGFGRPPVTRDRPPQDRRGPPSAVRSDGAIPPPILALVDAVAGDDMIVRVVGRDGVDDDGPAQGRARLIGLINDRTAEVVLPEVDLATSGMTTRQWDIDGVSHLLCVMVDDDGTAIYVARSLAEADSTLRGVRQRLFAVLVPVVVLSGLLGWVGARRLARPLEDLAASADHVGRTGELDVELCIGAPGEVGSVARSFGTMLDSLAQSRRQQQQLVADAGHEIRTPLTALRVNAEMLAGGQLTEADARAAARSIVAETGELAALADELVELATATADIEQRSMIDLGEIAERVAVTAQRRHGRDVRVEGKSGPTLGQAGRLERAMNNLVDNAVKFGEPDAPLLIRVDSTSVAVVDQGPGIDDADPDRIFDRFHRSPAARALPGSGLGLAIVDQVARDHGGRPFARNHRRGATVGFTIRRNFDPTTGSSPDRRD